MTHATGASTHTITVTRDDLLTFIQRATAILADRRQSGFIPVIVTLDNRVDRTPVMSITVESVSMGSDAVFNEHDREVSED